MCQTTALELYTCLAYRSLVRRSLPPASAASARLCLRTRRRHRPWHPRTAPSRPRRDWMSPDRAWIFWPTARSGTSFSAD